MKEVSDKTKETKDHSNSVFKPITGTFIDGIPCDIPSQNWSRREWAEQFDIFREMGMDSVVIIRVGSTELAMYASNVIDPSVSPENDMVALFLEEAQRNGLRLYMGLNDSDECRSEKEWDWKDEVALNLELIDELLELYGNHPAFFGWYLSHEPALSLRPWEVWDPLIARMREKTPRKPVLLSPRFEGSKWNPSCAYPAGQYAQMFAKVMEKLEGHIDATAFMDGHVGFGQLHEYVSEMKPVLDRHGIEFWSNLETFDRDVSFRFPPLDWAKMRVKLEAVQPYVSKIITFEAPHFLSPLSMWESGRMLYRRYREYIANRCE